MVHIIWYWKRVCCIWEQPYYGMLLDYYWTPAVSFLQHATPYISCISFILYNYIWYWMWNIKNSFLVFGFLNQILIRIKRALFPWVGESRPQRSVVRWSKGSWATSGRRTLFGPNMHQKPPQPDVNIYLCEIFCVSKIFILSVEKEYDICVRYIWCEMRIFDAANRFIRLAWHAAVPVN